MRKLGTIEVTVEHCNYDAFVPRSYYEVQEVGIVPEKGFKGRALSHAVGCMFLS